ncbi:MAG: 4-oxalmesaconate hydratase [Deltaproteobacteria bacterium]|jgi:4-oxalomesaconate hydratase|nr:4-oxalmesaconate hydratase [Deltaproteobacteria bacterium]
MGTPRSMLIISAHAADFVWRAGGAIGLHTENGGKAKVVSLSYGENGESGDLWLESGQTVEAVKKKRHAEASAASSALGADFIPMDLGDYPLEVSGASLQKLASIFVETKPDVVLVHAPEDPFNPDHPVASSAAQKARLLATGAGGVPASFETIPPPVMYAFEPHQPDLCSFKPDTFVDVTKVWHKKSEAMSAMAAQRYLQEHYTVRAEQRAYQARYAGFDKDTKYVEAFQRLTPEKRSAL